MVEDAGTVLRIAAFVLIGANFLFMMLCAGAFAFGLWIITSPSSLSRVIQLYGDNTAKVYNVLANVVCLCDEIA